MRQNNREATMMLQTYLRQLSYHDNDIPPVVIDGIFDSKTRDALRAFQRKNNLTPTGRADLTTFDLLYQKYLDSLSEFGLPEPLSVFPVRPDGFYFGIGSEGYVVGVIQYILRELSGIYDFAEIALSGKYDDATSGAVALFQEKNRIFPTGRVDKATWNLLAEQANELSLNYFNT